MFTIAFKPIIRWCIGGFANSNGYECLGHSICNIDKIYPGIFDKIILYNNCDSRQIDTISKFNAILIDQSEYDSRLFVNPMWKLIPPRLNIYTHEIFIDNDVVLYERLPLIEEFLFGDFCFMTEGLRRKYGQYDHMIPAWYRLNSGLFGLPPLFDLEKQMMVVSRNNHGWFDEQGLISMILSRRNSFRVIRMSDITVCENSFIRGTSGAHFVGLNNGNTTAWKQYAT